MHGRHRACALIGLVSLVLIGCSDKRRPQEDPTARHLRKVGQAYELATDIRNGRPPRNADELGRYFKELGETGEPSELLKSPRDGQPYVIVFGEAMDSASRDVVFAYEKNGAGSARYVLTLARQVKLMSDEEFARASFAKGHKPGIGK
jgi:hypothetical protein